MNTRQKRTKVSGAEKSRKGTKKPRKEIEYEVEYILSTQRHPDKNRVFPDNVTEALVKWVGYKSPTPVTSFDGCFDALWNCVEREDGLKFHLSSVTPGSTETKLVSSITVVAASQQWCQ